jgi:hypothetical protein
MAQYITIQDIYSKWCLRKACIKDPTHLSQELFSPLLSGRQYWSLSSDTNRLRDRFYLQDIILLNT